MLPHSDASTYAISKRIVGARTYWKVEENDDYFLIGELDFVNNGFKWVPEADNVDIMPTIKPKSNDIAFEFPINYISRHNLLII